MKNKLIKLSFTFLTFLLVFSCNKNNDFTNTSVLSASAPSLTVSLSFPNTQTLVEQEISYPFTVTLSEVQVVDVVLSIQQTSGTATDGVDFTIPHSITIPQGSLSASDVISIHKDNIIEDTETAIIEIGFGKEANISGNASQIITFNIANLTSGDLAVGMSWAASGVVTDNAGTAINPYSLADLRLLLTSAPNNTSILDSADGIGAESYVLSGAAPDGVYYLVADFYGAMSNLPADLDITLTFDQVGVINGQIHTFSKALNTTDFCANLNFVMAKVTKSGNSYTIEEVAAKSSLDLSTDVGTWSGAATWSAYFGYTSEVVTTLDANGDLWINGLAFQWFRGWWGEVIVTNTPVKITITDPCSGAFIITEQPYITSTWNGSPQPAYGLSGYGTITTNAGVVSMTVYPVFHQGGGSFSGPEFNGIPFVETLTLN